MRNNRDFIVSPRGQGRKDDDKKFLTFILFSESHGYRMKNYGPVQLTSINGKTLIEHQIKAIDSKFKNYEIICCCGFEAKKIWKFVTTNFPDKNIRIIENQLYKTTNSCESIRLALLNSNTKNTVICSGSAFFDKRNLDQIDFSKTSVLGQNSINDKLTIKIYKKQEKCLKMDFGIGDLSWSEFFYIQNEKDMKLFTNIVNSEDFKNKFLFEAINKMAEKQNISVCENKHKEILKIDSPAKLKEMS